MKKNYIRLIALFALIFCSYTGVRLYFSYTDGFLISNLQRSIAFEEKWLTRPLSKLEEQEVVSILQQKFYYLAKGCQCYAFMSQDGKYVLKLIKHQRFRTKPWLDLFAFIPTLDRYRNDRLAHKKEKLKHLLIGWQTAFNELPTETGVIFAHLNEDASSPLTVSIFDKLGREHLIYPFHYQFLLQHRVEMLQPVLEQMIVQGNIQATQDILDNILKSIIALYQRGYADHDHALLQNTGLLAQKPIFADVGQVIKDLSAQEPAVYKQALFNKTYRLRLWLNEKSPPLKVYLEAHLKELIGPDFDMMVPHIEV